MKQWSTEMCHFSQCINIKQLWRVNKTNFCSINSGSFLSPSKLVDNPHIGFARFCWYFSQKSRIICTLDDHSVWIRKVCDYFSDVSLQYRFPFGYLFCLLALLQYIMFLFTLKALYQASVVLSSTANTSEHQVQSGLLWGTLNYIPAKVGMHNCQEPLISTFLVSKNSWPHYKALCSTSWEPLWNTTEKKKKYRCLDPHQLQGPHVYSQTRMHA